MAGIAGRYRGTVEIIDADGVVAGQAEAVLVLRVDVRGRMKWGGTFAPWPAAPFDPFTSDRPITLRLLSGSCAGREAHALVIDFQGTVHGRGMPPFVPGR